jgi:predicted transcriptional regulator
MKKKKVSHKLQVGVRITPEMKQQLLELATAEDRTLASFVYRILRDYLKREKP